MSRDAIFFRNQAEIERNNAADATLQNVRDRCERAAASWDAMAVRAERRNWDVRRRRRERRYRPKRNP